MTGPDVLPEIAQSAGLLLAFVLGWAALFFVGPVACLIVLACQAAGMAVPAGSGWVYGGTAAAWLLALGGWLTARALLRLWTRAAGALEQLLASLLPRRPRRVIVVDAATGMPIPEQSSWDWTAKREAEFRDWADTAARLKARLRERGAAWRDENTSPGAQQPQGAPRNPGPRPAPRGPTERQAPPRAGTPPPDADRTGPRRPPAAGARAVPPPPPPPPPPAQRPAGPDPWCTLGIPRSATQDAIRTAYRELIKQYHPDRVAGMPREFQAIAHEKTREIRSAYESLRRGR